MSSSRDYDDSDEYWRRDERTIKVHGPEGFEGMRKAGRLAAETLDFITPYVVPGVSTGQLDKLCHDYILDHNAIPAPLGYRGYPRSICTSINHVVCHGIPGSPIPHADFGAFKEAKKSLSPKKRADNLRNVHHLVRANDNLESGDIVNIDVTVILDGWYGDTSRMFFIGDVSPRAQKLCDITYESMMRGIAAAKPGGHVGDIGSAIQQFAEASGFSVVRDFSGHGLGRIFHDAPNILHYGKPGHGPMLKPGMFFTVEPMINTGTWPVEILDDGWTAVTRDLSLSAQFEHSVGVTETGIEIFTLSPKELIKPPYDLAKVAVGESRETVPV